MDPTIGYHNLFETGTVTATSEDTGFEKENAYDGFTDDSWKPSGTGAQRLTVDAGAATAIDYFAIGAHDMATQGVTVQLQRSPDNAAWTNVGSLVTPTTDDPFMILFSSVSFRYYRLVFTVPAGKTVHIGAANIGQRLALPRGFFVGYRPPKLNKRNVVLNSTSEGGEHIGRSVIRTGVEDELNLDHLDPAWVRANWEPFLAYALTRPFFFAWYPTKYPNDVALVWSTGDGEVANSHQSFQSVSLPLRGRVSS